MAADEQSVLRELLSGLGYAFFCSFFLGLILMLQNAAEEFIFFYSVVILMLQGFLLGLQNIELLLLFLFFSLHQFMFFVYVAPLFLTIDNGSV